MLNYTTINGKGHPGTNPVPLGADILDAAIGDAVAALPDTPAVDLLPPHMVGHDPGEPGYAQLIHGDGW